MHKMDNYYLLFTTKVPLDDNSVKVLHTNFNKGRILQANDKELLSLMGEDLLNDGYINSYKIVKEV